MTVTAEGAMVAGPELDLGTAQAAELLKVSPSTVRRWADAGQVPHYRTLGGRRRYREAQIRRLARQLGIRHD